jgi:hypothetical protein
MLLTSNANLIQYAPLLMYADLIGLLFQSHAFQQAQDRFHLILDTDILHVVNCYRRYGFEFGQFATSDGV